jgi:hypothetical protein
MEEIYILSDGSKIDLSGKSQFEITSFLIKNPGAKKIKGGAKSVSATPKNNQAQTGATESSSTIGSLGFQKTNIKIEDDYATRQKKGIIPPPSAQPVKSVDQILKEDYIKQKSQFISSEPLKLPNSRVAVKLKGKLDGSKEDMKKFV